MNSDNIIFIDLDGPILEGKERHYGCYKDIIQQGGGTPIPLDQYWELKRNMVKRDRILELSGYQLSYNEFFDAWIAKIEQRTYLALDKLKPGALQTLTKWADDYKLVLVTLRQSREELIYQLNVLGIVHLFDEILCCDYRMKNSKYHAIKHKEYQRGLFIGDSEEDMCTASLLKIPFYAIVTGLRDPKYLHADRYYNEIQEIDIPF